MKPDSTSALTQVFSADEVRSLNEFQKAGVMHPFTCVCGEDLVATVRGWICLFCEYTQDWAHDFMKNGTWAKQATIFRAAQPKAVAPTCADCAEVAKRTLCPKHDPEDTEFESAATPPVEDGPFKDMMLAFNRPAATPEMEARVDEIRARWRGMAVMSRPFHRDDANQLHEDVGTLLTTLDAQIRPERNDNAQES